MTAQNTNLIDIFSQWREWFDSVSRESGLVEFKEATDLAVENLATKGLQFENLQPGDEIFVDASIASYYLWDKNGAFLGSDNFDQTNPNTYVFNANSTVDFFGLNHAQGFTDDSETVMLSGAVDFSGDRTISLGESFTVGVEDWDAIVFADLLSEVNIDLSVLSEDYYEATATNNAGDIIAYVGGAEAVYGSGFNDRITGDNGDNILQGSGGDDIVVGGDGKDLVLGGTGGGDILVGGLGQDVIIDIDGATIFGNEAFVNAQGSALQSTLNSDGNADVFIVGSNTTIKDFDLSSEDLGYSQSKNDAEDVVFVQLNPAALIAAGVSAEAVISYSDPANYASWSTFLGNLEIDIIDETVGSKQIQISLPGSGEILGAVSYFDSGSTDGNEYNPVKLDLNVETVISEFESQVSENRQIIEQFVTFDFSAALYVPLAVEEVRSGLIRASVIDRDIDPNDSDVGSFERLSVISRPENNDAAQAAIFVLGNADDKVISTGGTGDRFEFLPQGYKGSNDILLSDQSFGQDVIVDLARKDPQFSQTDDVIFLKGVDSIDELAMSRTSVGREGNTSLKIQTNIGVGANVNNGEITIFKQFDPLVTRFAIERLEIEDLNGNVQGWSLPTVSAIRDGRKIVDTVMETDIGGTGKAILIGSMVENESFKVKGDGNFGGLQYGGDSNFEVKLIGFEIGDKLDLSQVGLMNDYIMISAQGGFSFQSMSNGSAQAISVGATGLLELENPNFYSALPTHIYSDNSVTIHGEDFQTIEFNSVNASGTIVARLGSNTNFFSAGQIGTNGNFEFDGSNAVSSSMILQSISAQQVDLSLGSGSGHLSVGGFNYSMSTLDSEGSVTLDASQFDGTIDVHSITASGSVTLTLGTKGDYSGYAVETMSSFLLDAGNAATASIVLGSISAQQVGITLGSGSGSVNLGGWNWNDGINSDGSVTIDGSQFAGLIDNKRIIASGDVTVTVGSKGDYSAQNIGTTSDFTLDASDAVTGGIAISTISAEQISIVLGSGSGHVHLGNGWNWHDVMESRNSFTLDAGSFAGEIETRIAASGEIMILGSDASQGLFSAGVISTNSGFTLDGTESNGNYEYHIGRISAEQVSIIMDAGSGSYTFGGGWSSWQDGIFADDSISIDFGELRGNAGMNKVIASGNIILSSSSTLDISAQTIGTAGTFTFDGTNNRETLEIGLISASEVSLIFGDLSDGFSAGIINTNSFSLYGGDGANFSANIGMLNISDSDFSLIMPELGNGLTINSLIFNGSGTISGTNQSDFVSASSLSMAGGFFGLTFDMGEDSSVDTLAYSNGFGKEFITILNFDSGEDRLEKSYWSTQASEVGASTAASIIGGALGLTVAESDLGLSTGFEGATAMVTYNGDTYFLEGDGDTVFEDGEAIFRFVGEADIVSSDIWLV